MILNMDKTKVMLITSRQRRNNLSNANLTLQYNDIDINLTTCDKISAINVDNNLTWNNHFNLLFKKTGFIYMAFEQNKIVSIYGTQNFFL